MSNLEILKHKPWLILSFVLNLETEYFKEVVVDEDLLILRDNGGDSILSVSVKHNHFHCSKVILEKCPSLLHLQTRGLAKYTALHYAAYRGITPIVELLVLNAEKKLLRMVDCEGDVPLKKAVQNFKPDTVKLLIEADLDYEYQATNADETPLLASLRLSYGYTQDNVRVQIRQILLKKQPNQSKVRTGSKAWTALHHATYQGDLGAVGDIIRYCPTCMNLRDTEGKNFLHIAAQYEHVDLMKYILETFEIAGKVINGTDRGGETPLDIAIRSGNERMVSCLEGDHRVNNQKNDKEIEESELSIPKKHVPLYKKLLNQFGQILPDDTSKLNVDINDLAWDDFFSVMTEMLQVKPRSVSQEQILEWDKMATYCSGVGLQVSWFRHYVTHLGDWFNVVNQLEAEITAKTNVIYAKEDEFRAKLDELRSIQQRKDDEVRIIRAALEDLENSRSTHTPPTLGIMISSNQIDSDEWEPETGSELREEESDSNETESDSEYFLLKAST